MECRQASNHRGGVDVAAPQRIAPPGVVRQNRGAVEYRRETILREQALDERGVSDVALNRRQRGMLACVTLEVDVDAAKTIGKKPSLQDVTEKSRAASDKDGIHC